MDSAKPEDVKVRVKRCGKCGARKPYDQFGDNDSAGDGKQSYCKTCKNALGKRRRTLNPIARIKHHTATRIATQLGNLAPPNLTDALETMLGYKIPALIVALREDLKAREGADRSLREALIEGYHVDHIRPLSSFPVIKDGAVDWEEFRRCWAISNLRAIPAQENLAKGAKHGS